MKQPSRRPLSHDGHALVWLLHIMIYLLFIYFSALFRLAAHCSGPRPPPFSSVTVRPQKPVPPTCLFPFLFNNTLRPLNVVRRRVFNQLSFHSSSLLPVLPLHIPPPTPPPALLYYRPNHHLRFLHLAPHLPPSSSRPAPPAPTHPRLGMQRTTFVAQPAHFSMSAMRRILAAAAPVDNLPRYDALQPNSALFPPSSFSSSSSSTPPHFSTRRRRGSITQAASHHVMPIAVSSPVAVPGLSASAPSSSNCQSDMYDTHVDDSDDDFDDPLDDQHLPGDHAMWTSHAPIERSTPIAIPNAAHARLSRGCYASSPVLPDPGPIVTSYLIRYAAREGESSLDDERTRSARASMSSSIHRSPFAPEVPFGEVIPGKPDTGESMSRKMAYFDEDALY